MEIFGCCDISATWIFVGAILVLIYIYGKKRNQFLQSYGIPGPDPVVFIGNFHQFLWNGFDFKNLDRKKYGDVYGAYIGGMPLISIHDPDIIREVMIKDFNNFTDRMLLDLDDFPVNKGLFFVTGDVWKRQRHISSPTFSGAKLRMMCGRIGKCTEKLTENFLSAADSNSDINIKDYFGGYTMDVIASTGFGIECDSQNELNNRLMTEAKNVFADVQTASPLNIIGLMFPSTVPLLKYIGVATFPKKSVKYLTDILTTMIEDRKLDAKTKEKHVDLLQLIIDAGDDGTKDGVINTDEKSDSKKLSHDEILGQALLFFIAGYETTASTLQFAAYSLATNPDVQERLAEEVETILGDREPDYDNTRELTFLDHVLTETLRLYPVVPMVNRMGKETVTIKGHIFPKGAAINIPTVFIHRDPEVYTDPNSFKPERWERKSEIDPINYLPFGHGPRHCIGMRLAQVEMRIALAHVIRNIRFLPAKTTLLQLEGKDFNVTGTMTTKKPIMLRVERRR